jgi:hypothetical protein
VAQEQTQPPISNLPRATPRPAWRIPKPNNYIVPHN